MLLAQMLPSAVPQVFTQGMAMFGGALMLILGALTIGSGYGWGTWKTVFTQGPPRSAALTGTLLALLTVVIGLVLTGRPSIWGWPRSSPWSNRSRRVFLPRRRC
ncbi:hypothetical protein MPY17_15090 [Rhodococcus opacus]|uniref:hypothetical protein n=1 Tax=Rhodococcus opacus TaxID=37919 RepID=UPI001FF21D53|nr:hypothetical protein [Rhodococcus opacus]UOT06975.1 hypothetical protein MPY17_15090 [Rhodococcus opacus]